MDSLYCEAVLKSLEEILPRPPRSTHLLLSGTKNLRENVPNGNVAGEEYVLPDSAVSIIFSSLPIKDVFRLGFKLSRTWLEIWKRNPLVLHDFQMLPDHLRDQIMEGSLFRHNVAAIVTHILEMHPGPVEYMRLEHTTWKGGNAQLRLWIEKVIIKGVNELVLFGRWPQAEMDVLPNNIMHCCQLRKLTLCFFKIPDLSVDDAISFGEVRELIIAHCELREIDISIILLKCTKLKQICLGHITNESFTFSSASLRLLTLWNCTIDRLFILNCPELDLFLQVIERNSLHETQILISTTPGIRKISHLYLDQQTLYMDDHQITIEMTNHPQYEALRVLSLGVRFFGNYGLDVIREILICFPNLMELTITRMDPYQRHTTTFIKWRILLQGIRCVQHNLVKFSLYKSGLDDCEIDLAQSVLLYAAKLKDFVVTASRGVSDDALQKLKTVIQGTSAASHSIIKLSLGVEV